VLNWNGLADTREAIRSLQAQTYRDIEIWVADNGSANDEAGQLEREFGDSIRLLPNGANLGFSGGNNTAIAQILAEGRADHIALLNNDASAAPDWIERLVAAAETHPEAGVFASHMVFFGDPHVTENAGIELLTTGEAIPRGRHRPVAEFTQPCRLLGACAGAALYRVSALRAVGTFRDDYFANFEDVDLALRFVVTGRECRFVPFAFVRHKLNTSIRKVRDDAFRLRSVRNMTHSYWVNAPWLLVLLNLPWHVVSWLLVPPLALLAGQRDLARVLVGGRMAALRQWRTLLADRRALRPLRAANAFGLWWRQRSCFTPYWRYLVDVVLLRKRRYME
jgi:GT2 family glycosyltransferase